MNDAALRHRLDALLVLLVLTVSLLAGLLFRNWEGGELPIIIVSFAVLSSVVMALVAFRDPSSS
jgi:predicted RND superfamily exporter protein